jgi:four helix bundle protein
MAMVERFEDLIAWQKARAFTKNVYVVTRQDPFCRDFGLAGQIQRASVSTMSNIAEGVERYGPNELAHFLSHAKGSNGEARSQLYVALDVGYITQSQFDDLYGQANEVGRLVTGLRTSVVSGKR